MLFGVSGIFLLPGVMFLSFLIIGMKMSKAFKPVMHKRVDPLSANPTEWSNPLK